MKKNIFRPVEFWKSAIMTMPDNSFFELFRSVFGKIKTPFNKQQLLNDLETFLLREDIQKTIAAYIDKNDAKVIAAAALFGEPAPGELESFFSGEYSYAQLQDIIVNLEERFILYRFTEEKTTRLALNPVLENVLLPIAADIHTLFPAVLENETADASSAPQAHSGSAILSDLVLAGFLSFASQWESFYRTEGVIRKRVIEAGKTIFPGINLDDATGAMQVLGLFYVDGDKLVPDRKRFGDFGSLSARERMEYCAAALLIYSGLKSQTEILPPLFNSRIHETVNLIHSFLDSLNAEALYPEKTLKRILEILKAKTYLELTSKTLFDALEKTGLLIKVTAELKQLGAITQTAANHDGPLIAVDSGLSIIVYPEINFADAVSLASALNIREASTVVRFELDRDSAVRSFDNNIGADEIVELLKRLSGGKLDDALIWNLKDWEKRHGEVSLKKGVILTLSEDRRYLTETMPLTGMIRETLAPGLYLLDENAMDETASALRGAGIDIIARKSNNAGTSAGYRAASSGYIYFPPPSSCAFQKNIPVTDVNAVSKMFDSLQASEHSAVLTAKFHAILEKMPLGETEKFELSARINRRLVLCEAQLKEASVRYEKLEARHMDYAGKQNIAKQAIAQQSPVEIVWPGAGKGKSIFGIPRALEKEEGELILTVVISGEEDVMRIPLAKISLLRRIKKSIFEI
jgi:hypothetical protein